jgi:hypothetical protein
MGNIIKELTNEVNYKKFLNFLFAYFSGGLRRACGCPLPARRDPRSDQMGSGAVRGAWRSNQGTDPP